MNRFNITSIQKGIRMKDFFLKKFGLSTSKLNPIKQQNKSSTPPIPTSLRIPHDINNKLDQYSDALNMPKSNLIIQILKLYFFSDANDINSLIQDEIQESEQRLWYLFKSYNLDKTDILSLVNDCKEKHGHPTISYTDLNNLVSFIDTDLIEYLGDFFNIHPSWLLGEKKIMHSPSIAWYPSYHESALLNTAINLYKSNRLNNILFIKDNAAELENIVDPNDLLTEKKSETVQLLIILEEEKRLPNGRSIYIPLISRAERWNYHKTRRAFKKLYMILSRIKAVNSYTISSKDFSDLISGTRSAADILWVNNRPSLINREIWDLDDFVHSDKFQASYEIKEADLLLKEFNNNKKIMNLYIENNICSSKDDYTITLRK